MDTEPAIETITWEAWITDLGVSDLSRDVEWKGFGMKQTEEGYT